MTKIQHVLVTRHKRWVKMGRGMAVKLYGKKRVREMEAEMHNGKRVLKAVHIVKHKPSSKAKLRSV